MRDDFPKGVKDILAARVGNRCSMPTCRVPASGPAQDPGASVNIGVAAHVAAASPGGPRYDESQTRSDRRSVLNGIWLCETHAKLIDSDVDAYPVPKLLAWKTQSEALTEQMLAAGVSLEVPTLELTLPSSSGPSTLLSFTNVDMPLTGRVEELAELEDFLATDPPLSWWAWTGPAGSGKSRLALELCRLATRIGWDAGFITSSQQSRLGGLQNLLPTLVVVDYAAERGPWLADALGQLGGRDRAKPIRVLVLERSATGAWWDDVENHYRFSEGAVLMSTMHGLARNLGGIDRDAARSVARDTATQLSHDLSTNTVERIVDRALDIDPAGRPLFVQVATFDILGDPAYSPGNEVEKTPADAADGRDIVLRRVVRRSLARLQGHAREPDVAVLAERVLILATVLGGITLARYEQVAETAPPHLLPSPFRALGSLRLDDLVAGMKPDILGELLVLDRLSGDGAEWRASAELARLALHDDPGAFAAFVERSAADHPEHSGLLGILRACASSSDSEPVLDAAAATFVHLRRRDDPVIIWTLGEIERALEKRPTESLRELLLTARFRTANIALATEPPDVALDLFTDALRECEPHWHVRQNILNNRGIAHMALQNREFAIADFTAVVDSADATDEARACALNNRADLKSESGDLLGSIYDRTEVLDLAETTYNRRYIALVRRASTYRALRKNEQAYVDVERVLDTGDIALEQKMAVRLLCATWLHEDGRDREALAHLDVVLTAYRNFDDVEQEAKELRGRLAACEKDIRQ